MASQARGGSQTAALRAAPHAASAVHPYGSAPMDQRQDAPNAYPTAIPAHRHAAAARFE
eukprot:CAMPEP_0181210610 /NCGR_PEP_ID=MMETSP1096-20121128/23328_1 /TAXON_ID=156174 ORGANISM="Chrysochromulina ericina, Strain CCMP281" /NCGR_SAMPLE_ID=MMETSP1096 /ASSEMBLY_ACC=CAM_ASM_000453 /LENGTH=58 /DNA_ID=CAMNT_0023301923 /DNA_START=764 /DNA_END=940 /DNA_ORIENTATION=+